MQDCNLHMLLTIKEISLQQGLYNNTNGEWEDALIVSLTRANIVEQVQRLDEKS